ncbi:unnamed protein product [Arctogadus glacialis]
MQSNKCISSNQVSAGTAETWSYFLTPLGGGARAEKSKVKAEGTCTYCGEAGHGKTPQWRAECPAYGKTCQKFNRQKHLDKVCLGGRSSRPAPEETDGVCDGKQTTAFGELCTLTSSGGW